MGNGQMHPREPQCPDGESYHVHSHPQIKRVRRNNSICVERFRDLQLERTTGSHQTLCMLSSSSRGPGRFQPGIMARIFGSRNIPDLGTVTTSPAGSTDAFIVERTWGLLSATPSRKAEFYGPNFTFEEYLRVRNWIQGVALHFFLTLGPALLLLSSLARSLLRRVTHQPGQGSDRASATREEVEYRGTAEPDVKSGSGQKAFCRVRHFGGPYALSGLLMAQVALTLLEEDVQLDGGIYTSACLGQGLIDRAANAGFKIETEIIS
uniref:Uncharacterized protein n=1 Tax=Bionectria ochroleuca TaxID=29856 RepID=A0A8H7NAI3_BIOOC